VSLSISASARGAFRPAKTIAIRLEDGSRQTVCLTERAESDAGEDVGSSAAGTATVVVHFSYEAGGQVAHYFTRVS
jgi:hypothetical protein